MFKILNSLPKGSDKYQLALIQVGTSYLGMVMAERLFRRYPAEKFSPIVRLPLEDARAKLFFMTGLDLLDVDNCDW